MSKSLLKNNKGNTVLIVVGVVLVLLALAGTGYYFGVYAPKVKREKILASADEFYRYINDINNSESVIISASKNLQDLSVGSDAYKIEIMKAETNQKVIENNLDLIEKMTLPEELKELKDCSNGLRTFTNSQRELISFLGGNTKLSDTEAKSLIDRHLNNATESRKICMESRSKVDTKLNKIGLKIKDQK